MKSMLWKELRENLKWAALAFLCLTLAEFYTIAAPREGYAENFNDLTLCSSAFLMATAFGCSAVGVALAIVQILPELRPDQWAALLHRPVARGTIFFGKVLAGVILYFGATAIPFALSVCYVAVPGQFAAPLVPGMLIPGLSDLFLGAMFYFATLLLCLHRGYWWGSRGAIALSVIPIFIQHLTSGWPFLVPIACSLVYLAAAWGAMISNGGRQSWPWAGRLALVLVVLMGAEAGVLLLLSSLQFVPKKESTVAIPYTDFAIAQDGQVFFSRQNGDGTNVLTDMKGNVITDPRYASNSGQQNFCRPEPLAWQMRKSGNLRTTYIGQSPRNGFNYLMSMDNSQEHELWFLLRKENYFIGYDKLSRRVIGICDADGFKPPGAIPKPFPLTFADTIIVFRNPHLFWSGTQVYSFDFPERSMTSFKAGDEPIYGGLNVAGSYSDEKPTYIAMAMENAVHLFDAEGAPGITIPYPHDPSVWSSLDMGINEAKTQIYLQSEPSPPDWRSPDWHAPKEPVYLDVFDTQGHLLNSYSHPDDSFSFSPPDWKQQAITFASPLLPAIIGTIHDALHPSMRLSLSYEMETFVFPQPSFHPTKPELLIIFVIDLALALGGFAWARRLDFPPRRAGAWALFVLCFGLPGLVAFRLTSDAKTRVRCPHCGNIRPLSAEECPVCHRSWPAPAASGIEIFDGESISA